jgi:hypothetical protein
MNIDTFDRLLELEESVMRRLDEPDAVCSVCGRSTDQFRVAVTRFGTLLRACPCGGEFAADLVMFTDLTTWIERGPKTSERESIDVGEIEKQGPITTESAPRRAGAGEQTLMMKTTKRTIVIDVPASADLLTAGLDLQRLSPELATAQQAVTEAERQLEVARTDIQQRKKLMAKHTSDIAQRGVAAVDDFEKESLALRRAELLMPLWETNLANARKALATARDQARDIAHQETRDRQAVLDAAATQLLEALEDIAELEDALAARAAQLPTEPGAGVFSVASIRQRLMLVRAR